jgi:uncharacterized membrane protein
MGLMLILLITAVLTARKKKTSNWFNRHWLLATCGVISALAGALAMIIHKQAMSYPHFASPHALGGLATIIVLLITPTLGMLVIKGKEGLRPIHKVIGRITLLLVLITAVFGTLMLLSQMKII